MIKKTIATAGVAIASILLVASAQGMMPREMEQKMMEGRDFSDVKKGMKGDRVKEYQKYLIDNGLLQKGADTGFFGGKTEEAMKKFEERRKVGTSTKPNASSTNPLANLDQATKDKIKAEMDTLASATVATCVSQANAAETAAIAIMKKYVPTFVAPANTPADRIAAHCKNIIGGGLFGMRNGEIMPMPR